MSFDETKTRVPGADVPFDPPGWVHYIWLIYLGFLFMPLFTTPHDSRWLWPTLGSIPVFLLLYVRAIRTFRRGVGPESGGLLSVLTIAVMAYALALVNDSANTYLIYCVAVAPFVVSNVRRVAVVIALLLGGYALEQFVLGFRPVLFGITAVVSVAAAASNYMLLENRRKNLALRRSSEEVQRLARVAERERIGRDLHDLLGHTLSLIAIKSELAAKLLDRDRVAAAREIADVTNIAREALKQVRTAVTGIRAAALEGELASARLLLETTGVALIYEHDGALLPAEVETTLAMIVREAVTNIQRHAGARRALIRVSMDEREVAGTSGIGRSKGVLLHVSDDGRGGITAHGNGLSGISERAKSLGGTLHIESPRGKGSVLCVRLPLGPAGSSARLEDAAATAGASSAVAVSGRRGGVAAAAGEARGEAAAVACDMRSGTGAAAANAWGGAAAVAGDTRSGTGAAAANARSGATPAAENAGAETPLVSTSTVVQT
jgi:two-component system, NarL family, sensor histidine kinase DesK